MLPTVLNIVLEYPDLRRAHAVHPISALQIEYSPFVLFIEDPKIALLETARELGVTIVVYSPLGRGLITGQYVRPQSLLHSPGIDEGSIDRNLKMTLKPAISGGLSLSTLLSIRGTTTYIAGSDWFLRTARYSKENFPKILDVVSKLADIGKKHNATAGQVTLAWILAQGDDFVVIPGTKKIKVRHGSIAYALHTSHLSQRH